MRKTIVYLAATVALTAMWAASAGAAGARIFWQPQAEIDRYKLFVAQPDGDDTRVMVYWVQDPGIATNGSYFFDVHEVDPLRPAMFLMLGISRQGFASEGSNVVELDTEAFCGTFDVDGDDAVTPHDALVVARKALGLRAQVGFNASMATALDVLRLATTLQCA